MHVLENLQKYKTSHFPPNILDPPIYLPPPETLSLAAVKSFVCCGQGRAATLDHMQFYASSSAFESYALPVSVYLCICTHSICLPGCAILSHTVSNIVLLLRTPCPTNLRVYMWQSVKYKWGTNYRDQVPIGDQVNMPIHALAHVAHICHVAGLATSTTQQFHLHSQIALAYYGLYTPNNST